MRPYRWLRKLPSSRDRGLVTATVVCLAVQFFGESAGVEPAICVENTQLTDSENASIAENATISKSAVQSLYKDCQEFPELQPSDFPAWCKNTLKRY